MAQESPAGSPAADPRGVHLIGQHDAGRTGDRGQAFRPGFLWGSGTSSYQIEGSPIHDGGGESVWDTFARQPGAIKDGHSGDIACDHYRRHREDVGLMQDLGLGAYRFSIAWSRLFPEGVGRRNENGFAFYDRLIDDLLAAGVTPWITLFHWDYPQALQQRGGWMVRESTDWFADYARAVVERFSDRVRHWFTHNEPEVHIFLGHHQGTHAPGEKRPWADILQISHHMMLAHGKAVQAMRAAARQPLEIGYVAALWPAIPATDSEADLAAARKATFGGLAGWLLEPVYKGEYPQQQLAEYAGQIPRHDANDLEVISQPLDFFAMNAPTRVWSCGPAPTATRRLCHLHRATRARRSGVFDVVPQALYWGPRWYHERYGLPIYVTENGLSLTDWVSIDGRVDDPQRIDFMRRYLRELRRAAGDGVDVRGYFYWSLLDNFRMGRRLSRALRPGPCRLCDAKANAQAVLRLVQADDRGERRQPELTAGMPTTTSAW
ncbi:MAG: family 1 glycosylhydrolase [Burkholderiaceae bacterium]